MLVKVFLCKDFPFLSPGTPVFCGSQEAIPPEEGNGSMTIKEHGHKYGLFFLYKSDSYRLGLNSLH